jgi:hypothetical protein
MNRRELVDMRAGAAAEFTASRADAKMCSAACCQRLHRQSESNLYSPNLVEGEFSEVAPSKHLSLQWRENSTRERRERG